MSVVLFSHSHPDEMYAEVCAYLTSNKYFELPDYCVSSRLSLLPSSARVSLAEAVHQSDSRSWRHDPTRRLHIWSGGDPTI